MCVLYIKYTHKYIHYSYSGVMITHPRILLRHIPALAYPLENNPQFHLNPSMEVHLHKMQILTQVVGNSPPLHNHRMDSHYCYYYYYHYWMVCRLCGLLRDPGFPAVVGSNLSMSPLISGYNHAIAYIYKYTIYIEIKMCYLYMYKVQ